MVNQTSGEINRSKLHLAIIQTFSQPELRALCFDLSIDYDDLPPGGRSDKVWELIASCSRTGSPPDLLNVSKLKRPKKTGTSSNSPHQKMSRPLRACARNG